MLTYLLSLSALLLLSLASPVEKRVFGPNTVFDPTKSPYFSQYYNPGTRYARTLQLTNGDILCSWENSRKDPEHGDLLYFPIFKSKDGGKSWAPFSNLYDTQYNWGMKWQPQFLQLKNGYGDYPAGTVLLAGTSPTPVTGANMTIDLYASRDEGKTWEYVSNIAKGGRSKPVNGYPAIWEPFLLEYNGQMILYYSDQRDPAHGQKLVYTTSSDLKNWAPIQDTVAHSKYSDRPGMAVVSKMGNGKYFLTYEFGGSPYGAYAVYYRIADDPTQFQNSPEISLKATDGSIPDGSPYNVWVNTGGNGTLIVNGASHGSVFKNTGYGEGPWTRVTTPSPAAYSRGLEVLQNGQVLIIAGGPNSQKNGTWSKVQATEISP